MDFDVIVVGLGAVGSAALSALARLGVAAAGIDRFDPPHDRGSSHGETRITRLLVGEGDEYVPLVRRSHAIWRTLEASQGSELMRNCGLLLIGPQAGPAQLHGQQSFIAHSRGVAARNDVAIEELSRADMASRYPQFALAQGETALFEPTGGLLFPERCVAALLQDAAEGGAVIFRNEKVVKVEQPDTSPQVVTEHRTLRARIVLLTAGPWVGTLAGPAFASRLVVRRQTLHWFDTEPSSSFAAGDPVFIWLHGASENDSFYGFPPLAPGGAVKVATEQYHTACLPDSLNREVPEWESRDLFGKHVASRLRGVTPATRRAAACMYTQSRDSGFIIERIADAPAIIAVSACSGHGFKHAAGLGEALAQQAVYGSSDIDLAPFAPGRLDRAITAGD